MNGPFQVAQANIAGQSGGKPPDLPPLKWSSLKYGFAVEDRIDGKEEAYS